MGASLCFFGASANTLAKRGRGEDRDSTDFWQGTFYKEGGKNCTMRVNLSRMPPGGKNKFISQLKRLFRVPACARMPLVQF